MQRSTSQRTYRQITKEGLLPRRRLEVYQYVFKNGPCTAAQIEEGLANKDAHKRLSELRDVGVLYEVKEDKCPLTRRYAIYWDVTGALPRARKTNGRLIKKSSNKSQVVRVGVSIVVTKNITNTQVGVLLGKRKGAHGAGLWAFPGGKIGFGEDPELTASRELEEEVGMCADPTSLRMSPHTNNTMIDGQGWVTLFYELMVGRKVEPQLMEPDKCEEWDWFSVLKLPQNLFPPAAIYSKIRRWRQKW